MTRRLWRDESEFTVRHKPNSESITYSRWELVSEYRPRSEDGVQTRPIVTSYAAITSKQVPDSSRRTYSAVVYAKRTETGSIDALALHQAFDSLDDAKAWAMAMAALR